MFRAITDDDVLESLYAFSIQPYASPVIMSLILLALAAFSRSSWCTRFLSALSAATGELKASAAAPPGNANEESADANDNKDRTWGGM